MGQHHKTAKAVGNRALVRGAETFLGDESYPLEKEGVG